MNPASFNSSSSPLHFIDLNEDIDHQHLISNINPPPQQLPTSSLSCPIFFNLTQHHYQSGSTHPRDSLQNQNKVEKFGLVGGSSESKRSSSDDGSVKWMSSKMRVMRKMRAYNSSRTDRSVEHKFNDIHHTGEINSTHHCISTTHEIVRVCSDCNTTKTPLWRGGPQGPKSLCNACGIRQRKARKAMALAAAAANATQTSTDSSTSPNKTQNKEKKSRKSYVMQPKQHGTCPHNTGKRFEDFALSLISKNNSANFQRVFPQDEEEAALLLMALSCGFIHG